MVDGCIIFDITDNCPGLPTGAEAKVFDKFYRGETNPAGGAGLGLPIVKGFATLKGATVTAQNRRNRAGAVFSFAFPESATA